MVKTPQRLIEAPHRLAKAARRFALLAMATLSASAWAQNSTADAAAFQVKLWAASCMACHGTDGRAEGTGLTIGGLPAKDLLDKLLGYKRGTLPATIMHQHAKGYSDDELSRIADYFSSLK
jgi:cytochrome c553